MEPAGMAPALGLNTDGFSGIFQKCEKRAALPKRRADTLGRHLRRGVPLWQRMAFSAGHVLKPWFA